MDKDFLTDLFESFGTIDIKRMFGGFSLSADGVPFALVIRDRVYFKTDEDSRARFAAEGCGPFSYTAKGRPMALTSYWRMPERLYDDPDETADWARQALGFARRAAAAKAVKPRKTVATNAGKPAVKVTARKTSTRKK